MPHGIMDLDQQQTAVPKINAPDDDTGRPSLNIVPATPVSGGGLMRTAVPFQQTLATLTQATELTPDPQQQPQPHSSPYHFPNQELDSSPVPPNHVPTSLNNQSNAYLFPDQSVPRPRANSDNWQGSFTGPGIVNDFPNFENQNRHVQERQQLQSFSFGGNPAPSATNNFLAADSMRRTVSDSLAAPRGNAHRQSRSDDIRPPMPNYTSGPASTTPNHAQSNSIAGTNSTNMYLYPPSSHTDFIAQNQNNPQQFLQPGRRSLSPGVGHIRRASSGSRSGRGAEVWGSPASQMEGQHLTPGAHALGTRRMSPYPSPNASPRVPLNDLEQLDDLSGVGLGTMNLAVGGIGMSLGSGIGLGLGLGGVGQVLPGLEGIGEPPISAGYENDVTIAGQRGAGASAAAAAAAANSSYINDGASSHGGGHRRAESVNSDHAPIAKQNVTTGRTANASIRRRKQDANFVCTVPGCGSTFTRGFNLKGHLRSHYEQKPYKCHWPGCDKGFARQHDCKRHEQLHSNYRPFTCDGCGKNFARMDALNRHLRSEAGGECVRVVGERGGVLPGQEDDGSGGGLGMAGDGEELKPLPRRRNTGGMGMGEGAWPLPL